MQIYVNSEPEEIKYQDELVVEIRIKHSEGVDWFIVGGFKRYSEKSKSVLKSFILMLEDLDKSIRPGPHGVYSHKRDFRNWFNLRVIDEFNPIAWPDSLLSKDNIVFEDYNIYYYDEYGRKYSTLIGLEE